MRENGYVWFSSKIPEKHSEACITKQSFLRNQERNRNQHWTSYYKWQVKTFHTKNTERVEQNKPSKYKFRIRGFQESIRRTFLNHWSLRKKQLSQKIGLKHR